MLRFLIAVVFCLASVPVFAQNNPVSAGQPFGVRFDHSGQDVTGFQCWLDGKPIGDVLPITDRVCRIPGQPVGTHVLAVEAINSFGKAKSADLTATAGGPPQAPTNLQIVLSIVVNPNGTAELLAFNVVKQ